MNIPKKGIIIPKMGISDISNTGLADALFSRVQQRVLGILYGQPDRSFFANELIGMAGVGIGAVHRELKKLETSGLVTVTRLGNQKHYRANAESPIFMELHGLITKTVGLAEPLRQALTPFYDRINTAFIYGSVAKGRDTTKSDIDLMVIGKRLAYAEIYEALQGAEAVLRRPINPNLMTSQEWKRKLKEDNSFVKKIQQQPKIFVIGSEDDLA